MAVLEAAADSVDSLAAGLQTAFEAIAANPKYKPYIMKQLPADSRHGSSNASSSSDGSYQIGAAHAA